MVSNDDFDGKATHLNCFYLHINFEQKYPKPAIVELWKIQGTSWHSGKLMFQQFLSEVKDGVFLNSDSFEALFHYFLRGNFGLRLT